MNAPLTCRELVTFLDAYVADELPHARRDEFDGHLATCADCRAYLASYRSAIELGRAAVRTEEIVEVPDALVDSILDALERDPGSA